MVLVQNVHVIGVNVLDGIRKEIYMRNKKIIIGIFIILVVVSIYLVFSFNLSSSKYIVREIEDAHHIDDDIYTNEGIFGENIDVDKIGNRINSVSKLTEEHSKDGFVINDLYLSSSIKTPDYCVVNFDITNNSNIKSSFNLAFNFYDKNGNVIVTEIISIGEISKGEKINHSYRTFNPIINAYSYSFNYFEY